MNDDAAARLAVGAVMLLTLAAVGGWVLIRWYLQQKAPPEATPLAAEPLAARYGQRA
jgi:hypothetical protein